MNDVLKRIYNLMEIRGLSTYALCKQTGIPQSTFSAWKIKDRVPDNNYIVILADALGCSTDYLLKGEDYYIDPEVAVLAQEMKDNPELQILLDATRNLSPEGIKSLNIFIEQLKKGSFYGKCKGLLL